MAGPGSGTFAKTGGVPLNNNNAVRSTILGGLNHAPTPQIAGRIPGKVGVGRPGSVPKPAAPPKAPAPTAAPSSPGGGSGGGSAGGGGVSVVQPMDAQAIANINENLFKANQSIANDTYQQSLIAPALQTQLGQLSQQGQLAQLRLATESNARGGLLSAGYGQQAGNLGQAYTDKAMAATQAADTRYGDLARAIASTQGDIPFYNAQQSADAAARLAQQKQTGIVPGDKNANRPADKPFTPLAAAIIKGVPQIKPTRGAKGRVQERGGPRRAPAGAFGR